MGITFNPAFRHTQFAKRVLRKYGDPLISVRKGVPLRQNGGRLRSLLSSIQDLVFGISLSGVIDQYYETANTEHLYAKPEKFIGKHVRAIFPLETAKVLERAIEAAAATGKVQSVDYPLELQNGETDWFNATISPVRDPSGKPISLTAVVRNITERKRTEKALIKTMEMYRGLFEKAPIGFHNISPKGIIEDVNEKWLELLGYTREEVIGKSIFDFIVPEQKENARKRFEERIQYGKPVTPKVGDRKYVRKDGSRVYIITRDTVVKDNDGAPAFVQTSFLDITELRETERKKAELEAALAIFHGVTDHFSQAVGSFSFYADPRFNGLQEIMDDNSFIDFGEVLVSLESLKKVGKSIIGTINLLRAFRGAAIANNVPTEKIGLKNVSEAIDEALEEAGVKSEKMHFDAVLSLPDLLVNKLWIKKALSFFIDDALDAVDRRDEERVRQNLIRDGKVRVDVKTEGEAIVIKIIDNGHRYQSITADILKKPPLSHGITYLYVEYLKLALAMKYIEAHEGKCEIGGDMHQGTTFTISLPFAAK